MNDIRNTTCHRRRCFLELSAVTVPSEAALLWGIDQSTIYLWLNEGKLIGVQVEGSTTWLVSIRDLRAKLGDPPFLPDRSEIFQDLSDKSG